MKFDALRAREHERAGGGAVVVVIAVVIAVVVVVVVVVEGSQLKHVGQAQPFPNMTSAAAVAVVACGGARSRSF